MRVSEGIYQFIDNLPERYRGTSSEQPINTLRNAYEELVKDVKIL